MAGKENAGTSSNDILREVIDISQEISFEEIIEDVNSAPPDRKIAIIRAYLRSIDSVLIESFDTGEWFKGIIKLRDGLQEQLNRYTSLEFKVEGLEEFLGEVKKRLIERMQVAHDRRGNDWLWKDTHQETAEEYIDQAAFSVLLFRRLKLGKIGQMSTLVDNTIPQSEVRSEVRKVSLESKLAGFDKFVEVVKTRIFEGDARYGDAWLIEDQPRLIEEEIIDTIGYAYFGWRKAKMLGSQSPIEQEGKGTS